MPAERSRREDPRAKLVREAREYAELYGRENKIDEATTRRRVGDIVRSIEETGTYEHTLDEIRHGARVAWRNAPKCINRKFYATLEVLDARGATTNEEMFDAIKEHLRAGLSKDHIPVLMTVFRPETPGREDGPRVWNSQLIRYAGHRGPNETVIGDPAELEFTEMVKKHFNWEPKDGQTMFDTLPIVTQIHPNEPPAIFELPEECLLEVPIHHPDVRGISALGLKWYAIPAVSNMTLDLGGLRYTAAPFNGWYMVTEIATRNFGDEGRYNVLPQVAQALGIDSSTEETLWRDHALAAINYAVLYSFKRMRVSIVDHHTAAKSFADWYGSEMATRGYCPGNWKWIIPPTASSTSSIYLGLNKMTEYTLKPALVGGMSLKRLVTRARESGFFSVAEPSGVMMTVTMAAVKWRKRILRVSGGIVLYASDGGRTQSRATWLWTFLRQRVPMIHPINLANPDVDFASALENVKFIMLLASTTGSGEVPNGSGIFIKWAKSDEGKRILNGKRFSVCAFGSRAYPKFCAGGKRFADVLRKVGAEEMYPVVCVDQLGNEDTMVRKYTTHLFDWMRENDLMTESLRDLMVENLENGAAIQPAFYLRIRPRDSYGMVAPPSRIGSVAVLTDRTDLGADSRSGSFQVTLQLHNSVSTIEYYKPGDHVAIWPRTNKALARYFTAHFGLNFDDQIDIVPLNDVHLHKSCIDASIPNPVTVEHLFTNVLDINTEPSGELLSALAHYVEEPECKADLEELALDEDQRRDWIERTGMKTFMLFDYFPTLSCIHRREPEEGCDILRDVLLKIPKLRPRYYSISSSPAAAGNSTFDLTVGRVMYTSKGGSRLHLGFCSDFLATLPLQSNVVAELRPAPSFRLPKDSKLPVIMIAAGTGIAPFKGFVDHFLFSSGNLSRDAWLIYGCQNRDRELYASEMENAVDRRALSKYLVCYSRDPDVMPKTYVDQRVRENADAIKDMILRGGHVYVCGDIRIEQSVNGALADILGDDYEDFEKSARYHLDIFGAFDIQRQLDQRLTSARKSLSMRKSFRNVVT